MPKSPLHTVEVIDLLPSRQEIAFILKGVFDHSFLQDLITQCKAKAFSSANNKYPISYRNNERFVEDNMPLAKQLFNLCKPHIPNIFSDQEIDLTLAGLNSRLRYCKYSSKQYFAIHQDGIFYENAQRRSALTFLLYLSDGSEFEGGETAFFHDQHGNEKLASYRPQIGDVAVFQHDLWHSGEMVSRGSKYILRSDFIYLLPETTNYDLKKQHQGYIWKITPIDQQHFATASRDKSIKIWNSDFTCLQTLQQHQNSVFDINRSSNGDLYAVSRDGFISRWGLKQKFELLSHTNSQHPCVLSVTSSHDGHILTTGSDGVIRLWTKDCNLIKEFLAHRNWIWKCLPYKQQEFISCCADGVINIWHMDQASPVNSTRLANTAFRCLALNGTSLFAGDEAGNIHHFKLPELDLQTSWKVHAGIVRDILLTADQLYSCGEDNVVSRTDHGGKCTDVLYQHSNFATSLCLLNNQTLLSASYSGEVHKIEI